MGTVLSEFKCQSRLRAAWCTGCELLPTPHTGVDGLIFGHCLNLYTSRLVHLYSSKLFASKETCHAHMP